jgi:selenoprotein W-related protein
LAAEILREFEPDIERISLVPSDGGCYEVAANGRLLYSKKKTHRHPRSGEVLELIRDLLKEIARL